MIRSRSLAPHVVSLCALLLSAPASMAQGWVRLPNGGVGYITNYTTTGFFKCGDPFYLIGTCQAAGNSITLGSGAATMSLMFHGFSQIITASAMSQSVGMGTITKTFGGSGPFQFPTATNINAPLFFFSIVLNSSLPRAATGEIIYGYLPTSRTSIPPNCCQYWTQMSLRTTTPPLGIPHYPLLIYHSLRGNTMTVAGTPQLLSATVAIIPEPATIWLTATGLAGVFAMAKRRRRRPSE